MRIFTDAELLDKCEEYESIPFEARAKVLAIPENPAPVLNAVKDGYIPVHAPKNLTILAQSVSRGFGSTEESVLKGYRNVLDRTVGREKRQEFEIEGVVEEPEVTEQELENAETAVEMMQEMQDRSTTGRLRGVGTEIDPRVVESQTAIENAIRQDKEKAQRKADREGMRSEDPQAKKRGRPRKIKIKPPEEDDPEKRPQ
jgi:hypothetical protein